MGQITRVVLFNNWSLYNVPNLTVYAIEDYMADRKLNLMPLARRNARKLVSDFYDARQINISVYITAPSRAAADQAIDTLFQNLQSSEGTLTIEKSGSVRNYTCTLSKIAKNNTGIGRGNVLPPQGGFVDLTLVFECSDSFGYDPNYTQIYNLTNQTGASLTYPYTQGGGAEWQVPFIQLQYTAVSGGTNATVTVGNQATGQAISVTRTWVAGDILQIDSQNKTVQVNGVDVNFTGAFPEFNPGAQTIYYVDTFTTSRNFKFFAYVYNRWN